MCSVNTVAPALGMHSQGIRLLRVVQLLKTLYLELSSGALHHAMSRYEFMRCHWWGPQQPLLSEVM
jgi:hypothetical protein